MNLAAPVPASVIIGGVIVLWVIFLIGVFFVKNHPKAKKEK